MSKIEGVVRSNRKNHPWGGGGYGYFLETHNIIIILLHEKFLQFDWLRAVVLQLNLKYLHVKITNLLRVVV